MPEADERRRVFCASMADVFEDRRELDAQRERLWGLIEATPKLDWLLLTKRIDKVKNLAPWQKKWPANIWLGTSTENQRWFNQRIEHLLSHDATVRFISAEPLLGSLTIAPWLASKRRRGLDWVITGGESGAKARVTDPAWIAWLRDQCTAADVPFHFKQWGHWAPAELIEETIAARAPRVHLERSGSAGIDLVKVGKIRAGRLLDGITWDGVPA